MSVVQKECTTARTHHSRRGKNPWVPIIHRVLKIVVLNNGRKKMKNCQKFILVALSALFHCKLFAVKFHKFQAYFYFLRQKIVTAVTSSYINVGYVQFSANLSTNNLSIRN